MTQPNPDPVPVDARWFRERLPAPDHLEAILSGDPVAVLLQLTRTRAPVEPGYDAAPQNPDEDPEIARLFELATAAAQKLKHSPYPYLSPREIEAMHAFVHLLARPALRVIQGETPGAPEPWPELHQHRLMIARRIRGVGRLDTPGHRPAGTGWLVSPGHLLTNNHVAASLCGIDPHGDPGWRQKLDAAAAAHNRRWETSPERRPFWDPGEAPDSHAAPAVRVQLIAAVHPHLDMALLRVTGVDDSGARVLPLSAGGPDQTRGERVYVAGYPVVSAHLPIHPQLLRLLFGGASAEVPKRVAPGLLQGRTDDTLAHDASTLGGSSGSAIVEFDSHRVVGLHFSGAYGTANYAVPLWHVQNDPFFIENQIGFG